MMRQWPAVHLAAVQLADSMLCNLVGQGLLVTSLINVDVDSNFLVILHYVISAQ